MLVLPGKVHNLLDLGLGNFVGEDAADPDTLLVNVKHNLRRFFVAFAEEALQHEDDELHRRVVVIQHDDLVHRRFFGLRLGAG